MMRQLLRTGTGAILLLMIMTIGSLVLWIGTPLLWLWVGSQVEAKTESLGGALGVTFLGAVLTIVVLAVVLSKLSDVYRSNVVRRGRNSGERKVSQANRTVEAAL